MPQGKLKTKVSIPSASKKKSAAKKKSKILRKGARSIAPKKANLIEAAKLKKTLTQAINKNIEKEMVLQAGKHNVELNLLETQDLKKNSSK